MIWYNSKMVFDQFAQTHESEGNKALMFYKMLELHGKGKIKLYQNDSMKHSEIKIKLK